MSEKERLVKFELLGQQYAFYSSATEEDMRTILALVRRLVESGAADTTATLPVGKVAVMSCLNIASRYVKLKQEFEEYRRECEERMGCLSEEIRMGLVDESSESGRV